VLLVPYIIIGIMGGGTTLMQLAGPGSLWFGGAIVALVVMGYVFFGGMRGTAGSTLSDDPISDFWGDCIVVIGSGMGGFRSAAKRCSRHLHSRRC